MTEVRVKSAKALEVDRLITTSQIDPEKLIPITLFVAFVNVDCDLISSGVSQRSIGIKMIFLKLTEKKREELENLVKVTISDDPEADGDDIVQVEKITNITDQKDITF